MSEKMNNAMLHGCAFEGWQCFHCGEIFKTVGDARDHFGFDQSHDPACRIKLGGERGLLMALRKAQESEAKAWAIVQNENSEIARAFQSFLDAHRNALVQAEEVGYAKGLQDAKLLKE